MQHPRQKPGARGNTDAGVSLAGDTPNSSLAPHAKQADLRRRARFARRMVFEEFGYRYAQALDYDRFLDRKPDQTPRPSPEVRRLAWEVRHAW